MNPSAIFVDANAVVDLVLGEEKVRSDAEELRKRFPNWITLPLLRYEFGNVLRTYTRLGKIREEDGKVLLTKGLSLVTFCVECADEVVLEEANARSLTFYDAGYVAAAISLDRKLYTRDADILRNSPDIAFPIATA